MKLSKNEIYSKFRDAIVSLNDSEKIMTKAMEKKGRNKNVQSLKNTTSYLHQAIKHSMRFYLPNYPDEFKGIAIQEYFDLLKFPYDNISLLSYEGGKPIIINSVFNEDNESIYVTFMEKKPSSDFWSIHYVSLSVFITDPTVPIEAHFSTYPNGEEIKDSDKKELMSKASQTLYYLFALVILLNLSNVKPSIIKPSKIKQVLSSKKKPLYSYHVLEVDGVKWDTPIISTGQGSGKRSHFRRGHIRRFNDEKTAWIRPTMVKGSVKGFVDKDYKINKPF